ncbi:MAG: hypothetical protein ACOCXG_01315 [Nanoarchaeota archaeon]
MVLSKVKEIGIGKKLDFLVSNYADDILSLNSEGCDLDAMMRQIILSRTYLQNYVNFLQFKGTEEEKRFGIEGSYRFEKLDECLMFLMRFEYGIEIYLNEDAISYETVSRV